MVSPDLIAGQCIGLALAVPSFPLYIIQCAIVIGNRKSNNFNTIFYKFFLLEAFNNLLLNFLCSSMLGNRLTWIPALLSSFLSFPTWLSGTIFAINFYNIHAQNLLTLFMLIQRLTAILRPFDFEKIWHYLFPISAILCFSIPFLPIAHLFGVEVRYYPLDDGAVHLNYDHSLNVTNSLPSNSQIICIGSSISLFLYCILNLAIFVAFKASQGHHQNSSNPTNGSRMRIEFRLLIYSIVILIAQSLVCIYWILVYIFNGNNSFIPLLNQYIWINDIRTLVLPSWFLLWASGEMRDKVKEIIFKFAFCLKPKALPPNSLAQSNVPENNNEKRLFTTRTTPRNP